MDKKDRYGRYPQIEPAEKQGDCQFGTAKAHRIKKISEKDEAVYRYIGNQRIQRDRDQHHESAKMRFISVEYDTCGQWVDEKEKRQKYVTGNIHIIASFPVVSLSFFSAIRYNITAPAVFWQAGLRRWKPKEFLTCRHRYIIF